MTEPQNSQPLDPETVAAYLRQHPEFFIDHEELIPDLRIPHQRGRTVSLVEHQVKLLRERNIDMRHRLNHLMDVARDNDRLFDKTRRLVLDLLDADTLETVVSTVEDSLRSEFKVPYVSLILFSDTPLSVGRCCSRDEARQRIGNLLGEKIICGTFTPDELTFLFAGQAGQIGSAALSTLHRQGLQGVLAIGSEDPHHYKSSLGTLFLGYVAEVLARVLLRIAKQPG